MKMNRNKRENLATTALLAALVIMLQTMVFIPLGPYTITLTLIPIMVGAILLGPVNGAILGAVFGIVVSIQVPLGAVGLYSKMMFDYAPIVTILICIVKGTAAGFVSGWVYRLMDRKGKGFVGTVLAAVSAPIVNTGIFAIGLMVFYRALVDVWTLENAFANAFAFLFIFMIGLNFLLEFAINVLLIPVVLRVVNVVKQRFR